MKVAILGCAPSARMAPFYDDEWEIWGTGISGAKYPRWSRWFQLHDVERLLRGYGALPAETSADLMEWLVGFDGPVYMHNKAPGIPGSEAFDFDYYVDKFGRNFRATASWMMAKAIDEGATDIGIYGVDMAAEGEYQEQRPSVKFFEGWARGAGINVTVAPSSSLSRCNFLYGKDDLAEAAFTEYEDTLKRQQKIVEQQRLDGDAAARELTGALKTMQLFREDRI